ncbi:mucin-7-like [Setaria italica]|uniref:mucin-7-like n=1 Tax=Setaria italica TaxID=4555 RepID=UPI000350D266|nr:mucin-7-like [Setaria italica]XP_034569875.1 mucin-7-like [Setaria viridis]
MLPLLPVRRQPSSYALPRPSSMSVATAPSPTPPPTRHGPLLPECHCGLLPDATMPPPTQAAPAPPSSPPAAATASPSAAVVLPKPLSRQPPSMAPKEAAPPHPP